MCIMLLALVVSMQLFVLIFGQPEDRPVVYTDSGVAYGGWTQCDGILVQGFLGIPYAQPPVGQLRFRKTVPIGSWVTSPLEAVKLSPACMQYYPIPYSFNDVYPGQSEDCLYMNIWVPSGRSTQKKGVFFWIHSGGFSLGSTRLDIYDGSCLAAHGDVIVVTVGYRLGIFGLLYAGTDEAPGNMGIHDILEALRWVNNNIDAFGGERTNLTVAGQSIGGDIASKLSVSPLAKGLFKRVIIESGNTLRLSEDTNIEHNLELGQKVAVVLGCSSGEGGLTSDVIKCLRSINAEVLARTVFEVAASGHNSAPFHTFVPIYGDDVLPLNPRLAFKTYALQKVDALLGYNENEGAFELISMKPYFFGPYGERNSLFNKTFAVDMLSQYFEKQPVKEAAIQYYLGDVSENNFIEIRKRVLYALSEFSQICGIHFQAERYTELGGKVYYYYFTHRPGNSPFAPWLGAIHFNEVQYVFGRCSNSDYSCTEAEKYLSLYMITAWSDFVRFGYQNRTNWRKYTKTDPYVQLINLPQDNGAYSFAEHLTNCEVFRPLYFG